MLDLALFNDAIQITGRVVCCNTLLNGKTASSADSLLNAVGDIQCAPCFNLTNGGNDLFGCYVIYGQMPQVFKRIIFKAFEHSGSMIRTPDIFMMLPPLTGNILKAI